MAINVTLEELLEAGAHFGHQARRWNPKMAPYIYGVKEGVHVFDLVKTKEALDEALDVISKYSKDGKVILFVGTKKQIKDQVKALGEKSGQPYINERWLGGTLTNFNQVLASVRKLKDIQEGLTTGKYVNYTKKEKLLLEREVEKLMRNFGGLVNLSQKPDLIVIIDTHRETSAVKEAIKLNIPTVGITDSNADPSVITYPIPMNDDASKSLEFILNIFEKALLGTTKTSTPKVDDKKVSKKKVKVEKPKEEEVNVAD
jgi:small subunit ribosomal protein S2